MIKNSLSGIHFNFCWANFERVTVIQSTHKSYPWTTLAFTIHVLIFSIKMANVYVCGAVAIATLNVLSNRRTQARYFNSINVIAHHTGNYAFIDFKQWLTLIFADWNRWLFLLSKRNKRNLNSRWVVIFVLRLAKPLIKNTQWFCSAKVSHPMPSLLNTCNIFCFISQLLQKREASSK